MMKAENHGLSNILIILVLVLVAVGIYFLVSKGKPILDQTASWKTYINKKYAFSMKYPAEVAVQDPGPGPLVVFSFPNDQWYSALRVDVLENPDKFAAKDYYYAQPPSQEPSSKGEVVINRIKAFQFVVFAGDGDRQHTYFVKDDVILDVSYYYSDPNDPDHERHKKVFDQMLSTFKFTD